MIKAAIIGIRIFVPEQKTGNDAWVDIEFDDEGGGIYFNLSVCGDVKNGTPIVSLDQKEYADIGKVIQGILKNNDVLGGSVEMTQRLQGDSHED